MSNLTVVKQHGQFMVESRQVAEMVGKEHFHLCRDIKGYMEILGQSNFGLTEFFIESSYLSEQKKVLPCYLITKKGCELVGNKMIGEKGILFTAEYVTRFNEMEQQYSTPQLSKELQAIFAIDNRTVKLETQLNDLQDNMPLFNVECDELQSLVRKIGMKCLGGKESTAYKNRSLRGKVYSDIQSILKREFGVDRYKAIKRNQLSIAIEIVKNYKLPLVLSIEITELNRGVA